MRRHRGYFFVIGYFVLCWPFFWPNVETAAASLCLFGTLGSAFLRFKGIGVPGSAKAALVILVLVFVYSRHATLRGLDPGLELVVLAAVLKSLELRDRRDYAIYLLIVGLALMGSLLMSESVLSVAFLSVALPSLFWLLFYIHSRGVADAAPIPLRMEPRYGVFVLCAFIMAAVLFAIFPRFNAAFFGASSVRPSPISALFERLRLDEVDRVVGVDGSVFRVSFKGRTPARDELYWRGEVFNRTDGMNWERKRLGREGNHVYGEGSLYDYRVVYDTKALGRLFNLADAKPPEPLGRFRFVETHQGFYRGLSLSARPLSYRTLVAQVSGTVRPDAKKGYLDFPDDSSPRIDRLVGALSAVGGPPARRVGRLGDFFRDAGFAYADPGSYRREDFLDSFLFGRKRGLGGHFASAAALLMRRMGIASRVVVGFQGGQKNPYGDFWIVRTADIHAWVEYWDDALGWIRFDPTAIVAPQRIALSSRDYRLAFDEGGFAWMGPLHKLYYRLEEAHYAANVHFMNYDFSVQSHLLHGLLGIGLDRRRLLACSLAFAVFFGLVFSLSWCRRRPGPGRADAHRRQYSRVVKKLRAKGMRLGAELGPQEILLRATPLLKKSDIAKLEEITYRYIRLRYARGAGLSGEGSLKKLVDGF